MNTLSAERSDVDPSMLQTGPPDLAATVRSPATVTDATTGLPVLVTVPFPGDLGAYRRALRSYPMDTTVRSGGIRNVSRVFGFTGRQPLMKRNSCRACNGAVLATSAHGEICAAAETLAAQVTEAVPERASADLELVRSKVLPDWFISPNSWWTSGVVNMTSPLPYHYDKNNFPAWSAMVVIRRGVTGGHLHIPEYGIVVDCRDGDVVYFNGNDLMHGVTPMLKTDPDGYRMSAVYYPVAKMAHCLPFDAELARGRLARSEKEDDMIARHRESGAIQ